MRVIYAPLWEMSVGENKRLIFISTHTLKQGLRDTITNMSLKVSHSECMRTPFTQHVSMSISVHKFLILVCVWIETGEK